MVGDVSDNAIAVDASTLIDQGDVIALPLAVFGGHERIHAGEILRHREADHLFLCRGEVDRAGHGERGRRSGQESASVELHFWFLPVF